MDDVTAFVLAGGKSSRMGSDKAFLPWRNGTLLSHTLAITGAVATTVRIVGSSDKFSTLGTVVEDIFPDCGPLGGIHAALASTITALNLVVAVDLPFLTPPFLDYLLSAARISGAMVTIPKTTDGWQPLCAVYRKEFAKSAEQSLKSGKKKIDSLFADLPLRVIDQQELSQAGFPTEMFRNLNTPADLQDAQGLRGQAPQRG